MNSMPLTSQATMRQAVEAVWEQGRIIPMEPIRIREHARLLIVILDEHAEQERSPHWKTLRGKYRHTLSSVDEFIHHKREEKRIER